MFHHSTLPSTIIPAYFTLLRWLLLTPSAWQQHIQHLDKQLSADFALADLHPAQWRVTGLWRLLLLLHIGGVLLSVSIVAAYTYFGGYPWETCYLAVAYALGMSSLLGLLSSLTISVAFGAVITVVGGVLFSLPIVLANQVVFTMANNIAIAVLFMLNFSANPQFLPESSPSALLILLYGTFIASLTGSVLYSTSPSRQAQYRQIGSIMVGVFVSVLAVTLLTIFSAAVAHGVAVLTLNGWAFSLLYDGLIVLIFVLSFAVVWWLNNGQWLTAWGLGTGIGVLLALLTMVKNQTDLPPTLAAMMNGLHGGVENALLYLLLFALPYGLAKKIANPWAGVIAGIFASVGLYTGFALLTARYPPTFLLSLVLFAFVLGMSINWWRPLLMYPFCAAWNVLLYRADERRMHKTHSLLRCHSAFWDEHQQLPLFGLESYLVMVAERYPAEGQTALTILSNTSQRWAAQQAQIELDARCLQQCKDITAISKAHRQLAAGELSGPASALLRSFSRLSRDVEAALAQESKYNQRLALDAIEERLDGLLRELTRSSEPYARRFQPIAEKWRKRLTRHAEALSAAVESQQEINNPYIIGIPLTEHQEIFVGRSDVSERLERLLLDDRCPPLLLYGQRRTGKTSLLNNLGKLLPSTIVPLFVDLQGPASLAQNDEGFLYNIARAMVTSAKRHRELHFPNINRTVLRHDPFTVFDEWLDSVEDELDASQTLLFAADEFSALEYAFAQQRLQEVSVLGMFRHLIQHRPRFKILLSGSHTLDEFERWASYLINVQTVHLSYLQANEALQLIEHPVKDFALQYDPAASQRILSLTRCHPALVQLLCAEIVSLKNKQHIDERRYATLDDVNAAIPGALQHGRFFFADITNNQVNAAGRSVLLALAQQGEGYVCSETALQGYHNGFENFSLTLNQLLQRELLEDLGEGYRFQVELVRCWFATLK